MYERCVFYLLQIDRIFVLNCYLLTLIFTNEVINSIPVNPGAKERLVQITGANEDSIKYISNFIFIILHLNLIYSSHAKQLIEDTIRRNASPVREHELAVGGPLTGSSSSINSSASDDSALPSSARASRALMHSLSTNDANLGEYKYSVVTGGYTIRITGDNLDLVRVSISLKTRIKFNFNLCLLARLTSNGVSRGNKSLQKLLREMSNLVDT